MTKHIRIFWILAAFALACVTPAARGLIKSPPEKAILPNGLRVIVVEDRSLPIMAATLLVNSGWTISDPKHPSLAMLVEPLLESADTRSVTRFDLNARLEREGSQITFSTGYPGTSVAVQGSSQQLAEVLKTIRAVGFELAPTQPQLDTARRAVGKRWLDEKAYPLVAGYLEKQAISRLFPSTALSQALLPDPEDLQKVTLANMQAYLTERFVPNNALLIIVGDLDPSSVFKTSMEVFGDLPAQTLQPAPVRAERTGRDKNKEVREFLEVKTTQVLIAFEAPALEDPDMPAGVLWEMALGGTNKAWLSRLFAAEFPEVGNPQVQYRALAGYGAFTIGFESKNPEIDRVVSRVLAYLSTLYLNAPRAQELERLAMIQQTHESNYTERRINLAFQLGKAEMARSYDLATGLQSSINRITLKDMERVAKGIFTGRPYVVQIVHPLACQVRGELKTRMVTLSNGLQVLVKPYASSEVAAASLFIKTGGAENERSGCANLLAWMLGETVGPQAEKGHHRVDLDAIGGELTVEAAPNGIYLSGYAGKNHLRRLLKIIANLIARPVFDGDLLKRSRERLQGELETVKDLPSAQVFQAFQDRTFPVAVLPNLQPTPAALDRITIPKLQEFHRTWAVPGNIACTLIGNFDPDEVASQAEMILGTLPAGSPPPVASIAPEFQGPFSETQLVDLPIADQTGSAYLGVGYRLPSTSSSWSKAETKTDFVADLVLFHLLSWSRNGLIQRELIAKGLADEIQVVQYTTLGEVGWVFICLRVPADRLDESKQALQKLLDGLPEVNVSQDDIKSAQQTVKFYFARVMERSIDQARFLTSFLGAGLGEKFFEEINTLYNDVTIDKVKDAARRNFRHYLLVTGKPK